MPELPDVEVFKNYLDSTAIGKKVEKAEVTDEDLIEGGSRSFMMRLKDETLRSAWRHGKYLFVELDRDEALMLHFGMTGKLDYYKKQDDRPEYAKVILKLDNGYRLAFSCPRKFGEIGLVESGEDFIKEKDLGPDAFSEELDEKKFRQLLEGRTGRIKSTLMNQKILAGIGNTYADEILFHAEINPFRKVNELSEKETGTLYEKMNDVIKRVLKKLEDDEYPEDFLLNTREDGASCPRCDGKITVEKLSGRSTYYCKNHQN